MWYFFLFNLNIHFDNCNEKYFSKCKIDDPKDRDNSAKGKHSGADVNDGSDDDSDKTEGESRPQPGYFHVVASFILVVHGFTFLVPPDTESEDTDMMRTIGKWFGFDWDWMKYITPYAHVNQNIIRVKHL